MVKTRNADRIRRKQTIPSDKRTRGKDNAAEYIETEILDKDRWPMTLSAIAEETKWSRQHIGNTLEDYFTPAEDRDSEDSDYESRYAAYRDGFQDGFEAARKLFDPDHDSDGGGR